MEEKIRLGVSGCLLGQKVRFDSGHKHNPYITQTMGEFFSFEPVAFEPKPVQRPWPPLHVGGESHAALRRAACLADGWLGLGHTPESVRPIVERLQTLRLQAETTDTRFWITVGGEISQPDDLRRFSEAGVDRVLVSPWRRSSEAIAGLRRLAHDVLEPVSAQPTNR